MNLHRSCFHWLLTSLCFAGMATGAVFYGLDSSGLATRIWGVSAGLVLIVAIIDMVVVLCRKELGLDVIAVATIGGALALGESFTAVIIALMFSSGRALEQYAENRARQEMTALLDRTPRLANRYQGGNLVQVSIDEIVPGDRLLVRAGEILPVDGNLISTMALLDESSLTGESLPVSVAMGSALRSGAINAGDAFDMLATQSAQNSTFSGIVRLVEEAQQSRAPATRMANRYAMLFVPFASALAGLAWWITGDPARALAVAVVATPCPLILAVPVAIVCAMSRCAGRGVLIKQGGAIENMAKVKTLVLDKTGTLTGGHARLVGFHTEPGYHQDQILLLAASLEQLSGHSMAQAVVRTALERGLTLSMPSNVRESAGAGLSGVIDGKQLRVGTLDFACESREIPAWAKRFAERTASEGASGVYIALDDHLCAAITMADVIRPETPRALRLLKGLGVQRIVMLTGDRHDVAETIGRSLGVDEILSEQTPASKLQAITAARQEGVTMMVGDGINDAPALAVADVGVAMGARGAAAAAESAHVVLLVDRLDRLAFALGMAQETRKIALQSVIVGMGLSGLAMIVAAFGYLPPVSGAVLQELIDVVVIFNALRVLRLGKVRGKEHISADELSRMKHDHARLMPLIDRMGGLAERAGHMSGAMLMAELSALNIAIHEKILSHESHDDATIYPRVSRLIGGDDPMATLSSMHREIYRLARVIDRMASEQTLDDAAIKDLRKTMYALETVLRLHFVQEEEIYHNLSS